MNSNVGETIAYAWLRREKNCAFVNMNWRPIANNKKISDTTKTLIKDAEQIVREFCNEPLNKCESSERLSLIQTEIDAVGVSIKPEPNQDTLEFHVVEIECHDHKTGKGNDLFPLKVLKKYLRTAICLSEVIQNYKVSIYFITNDIAERHIENTIIATKLAEGFFKEHKLDFSAELIFGTDFITKVFKPLTEEEGLEHGNEEFYKFRSFFNDQETKLVEK